MGILRTHKAFCLSTLLKHTREAGWSSAMIPDKESAPARRMVLSGFGLAGMHFRRAHANLSIGSVMASRLPQKSFVTWCLSIRGLAS